MITPFIVGLTMLFTFAHHTDVSKVEARRDELQRESGLMSAELLLEQHDNKELEREVKLLKIKLNTKTKRVNWEMKNKGVK